MQDKKNKQKELMNEIVESIGYTGYMGFLIKDMPKYALAIPKLVAHKVIVVGSVKPTYKGENEQVILTGGDNFLNASLKGGYNYIKEVEDELNPAFFRKYWNYASNNPLLSGLFVSLFGGVFGGVVGSLLLDYFKS